MDKIDRTFSAVQDFACWSSSSSSSDSIGKNSDDDEGGENEVESPPYKGPLEMMQSLEEVLPIKRGISKFYKGKSKSFTNLLETESLPVKDLTKPENVYSRRRRNLLSHRICSRGGISKKHVVKSVVTVMSQREGEYSSSSSSGDDATPTPTQRQYHKNLMPRQRKGSFGNCVPVVGSPRCFTAAGRNIHNNIIC